MKLEYLIGVTQKPSSFSKIFIFGNGRDIWYAGSYKDVKSALSTKREIINLTNSIIGRNTSLNDWEWHHVVETQHMAQIINYNLHQEKWYNMPTILIPKNEHRYLSQNFNNNAFRELSTIDRSRNNSFSQTRVSIELERKKRAEKIDNLRMMYQNAYSKYPTFKKIANNVFNFHLK